MSIQSLMNQVERGEIVLPAIQRDFVWSETKIERLFDSIMRGYPIGLVLLWETYEDIQYRKLVQDFKPGNRHTFRQNSSDKSQRLKLVLDGQQRLQSLYVAMYGSFEGRTLYFDLLSGYEDEDLADWKYYFYFLTEKDAKEMQSKANQQLEINDEEQPEYYLKVADLCTMAVEDQEKLKRGIAEQVTLSEASRTRLSINISKFDQVFFKDDNILKLSVIDEDLPSESPARKTESDVLEIFVRINREGTPLSKSDLIFSMLKLNWKDSAEALPEIVLTLNEGNSFDIDTDFVVRCLFAVSNLPPKFDLDVLRKRNNVTKLQTNYDQCCDAIRATLDFVQKDCWCQSSKVLGGINNLVPFVYYHFHTLRKNRDDHEIEMARKALYLFAFTKTFSRYADNRLTMFIRDQLKPLAESGDMIFPFDATVNLVRYWERISVFDEEVLQGNHLLTLHLVQGLTGAKMKYSRNAPEVDHIFPRSILRQKGREEAMINHVANFWILAKGKNENKSNKNPAIYFQDVSSRILDEALIDKELLDYRRYRTFIETRSQKMIEKIN